MVACTAVRGISSFYLRSNVSCTEKSFCRPLRNNENYQGVLTSGHIVVNCFRDAV